MNYDYSERKLMAVLASDLEVGQALNVLGHLAVAIGANGDENLMGRPQYLDASGVSHLGIARYPLIITKTTRAKVSRVVRDAKAKGELLLADYPEQMLSTGPDDELAESLASVKEEEINYLGAMLYGNSTLIKELTGKFSLWR